MSTSLPLSLLLAGCADAVAAVRAGRSLDDALAAMETSARPGVQALTFHVLRRLGAATELRRALARRPPPAWVDALVCSALALLWPQPEPPYAAHTLVDQAVAAVRSRAPAAAGFVNAVLRAFLRDRQARVDQALHSPVARFNHPPWWIDRLRADWPRHWADLLDAANQRPPMTLRVNRRRADAGDYLRRLEAVGRPGRRLDDPVFGAQAIVLDAPCPVEELPGFADGEVSVQDASAQRAAPLLLGPGLPAGARVLDACAAPGGKTAHLLELADLDLLALDSDRQRLERVRHTLRRLQLQAEVAVGDAGRPADWWDGRPFDAILLDAPCSGSGVDRRHPDIRWLRRASDLPRLAAAQARLLDALWPLLEPGGRLVYATCSIFRAEGQDRADAFLQRHRQQCAGLDQGSPGYLLPLPDNPQEAGGPSGDGFFYALFLKT